MKPKTLLTMVVAVACGIVAVFGMNKMKGDGAAEADTVEVLFVRSDIRPGTPLDEQNTYFKAVPKEMVNPKAITSPDQFVERAATHRLFAETMVLTDHLGEKGARGASATIPDGMRVVTVPVDLTMVHAGMLLPGNKVDVLVTWRTNGANGPIQRTKLILKKIKIFAADSIRDASDSDSGEIKAKNISLLVTPKQGAMIMNAKGQGQIHLALRPDNGVDDDSADDGAEEDFEVDFATMVGDSQGDTGFGGSDEGGNGSPLAALREEQDQQNRTDAANEIDDDPLVPTWQINIYEGSKLRTEQVVLPSDDGQPAALGMMRTSELNKPSDSNETFSDQFDLRGSDRSGDGDSGDADADMDRLQRLTDQISETNQKLFDK